MPSLLRKLVPLLMAAWYAMLSVGGYALHDWLGCPDQAAQAISAAENGSGCSCGHTCPWSHDERLNDAFLPNEASQPNDGPTLAVERQGHNPHDCSLCAALAQVKLAKATDGLQTVSALVSIAMAPAPHARWTSSSLRLADARGPPTV
ncbi:hypothetical protein Mal64_33240 [Pseudobythopirellula maris]|uniref:DUF2946 domain-containing protein n=2 Tax=Pseudobythopirellula maris TaxID=2527991 RepID=A0A5C5ZH63_9BACT|nr:hypothetical protein Mal64_33240 [Pseudobythopirellula maris]